MMRAILVDDEFYALQGLKMELEEIKGIEIVGVYESGKDALKQIHETCPDIAFIDIEMPEMNGIELFKKLLEINKDISIIFITAYHQYAVQAFGLNAMDYILKPISKTRILKALKHIKPGISEKIENNSVYVRCFGNLKVITNGQEQNSSWRTKKAEELFAYLLCEKGCFITKEKIAEVLWPELDIEKSLSNLYLAYFYLKKQFQILGVAFPVESVRGKMRVSLDNLECDIIKFDCAVEECMNVNDDNVALIEEIEALYCGVLLKDDCYEWVYGLRHKFEMAHMELLQKLVNYHMKKGNTAKFKYYTELKRNSV